MHVVLHSNFDPNYSLSRRRRRHFYVTIYSIQIDIKTFNKLQIAFKKFNDSISFRVSAAATSTCDDGLHLQK